MVVAQISTKLDKILLDGERKKLKQIDQAERKRLRDVRMKLIQDAKTEVFFNFARIMSFNRLQLWDMTRSMVYSLTPEEYHNQWFSFDFKKVKSMPGAIKNLLAFFNEYFSDYFRIDDKTAEYKSVGVSLPFKLMLNKRQPLLNAVEY